MKEFIHTQSLTNFETFIEKNILSDDGSIDFEKIGNKTFDATLPISSFDDVRNHLLPIYSLFERQFSTNRIKPLWYKVNIDDNIGNDNVGIGFLNMEGNWLKFILTYLQEDLAKEGGNGLIAIFDIKFKWVVNFEYDPNSNQIRVEQYEKNGS